MPFAIPCSPSLLISRVHFCLFSEWTRSVSSKFFVTQVPSISTAKLVLTRHVRCVLSRLRCNGHCLLLSSYFSRIGRIKNSSYSPLHTGFPIHFLRTSGYSFPEDTRPRTPLILFRTVQLRTLCVARFWRPSVSLPPLVQALEVARLLGLHGFPPCPHLLEGSANNNNKFISAI